MNNSFLDVTEIAVRHDEIVKMHNFLAEAGRAGMEGFAAWAGVQKGTQFNVTSTVIPRQTARRTRDGLIVLISADDLFLLNRWLYENQLTLIAQIHSHPTEAYHSTLDDEIPIATTQGCISIVVPNFAKAPFELTNCAVFRLGSTNLWDEISPRRTLDLIKIIR